MKILTTILMFAAVSFTKLNAQQLPISGQPFNLPAPAVAVPYAQWLLDNGTDAVSTVNFLGLPPATNIAQLGTDVTFNSMFVKKQDAGHQAGFNSAGSLFGGFGGYLGGTYYQPNLTTPLIDADNGIFYGIAASAARLSSGANLTNVVIHGLTSADFGIDPSGIAYGNGGNLQNLYGANLQTGTVTPDKLSVTFLTTNGNGGALTNLNASQLTGQVPLAAIPMQVVTNVPNSEIDAHGLYGQLQAPMRKPWHSIYICPSYFQGLREGESNIVQAVTNMRTNGSLTVASNLNLQMAVEIDVGGFATRTNSNWNYRLRNLGNMIWDTNTFPRGPWWINDYLHSNGFKSFIHFYATTKILPVGADEYICDYTGSNFQAWTNGNGTFPTNSFGPYNLCISADSATNDMTQLYGYGFDGVVIADGPPIDFPKLDTLIGNACLTVQIPVGWNNSLPYPGYANVNTGSFNASQPGQFVAEPANFSFGKVMMVQAYQSANANQNYTLGYQQIGAHASVFYDNTSQAGGVGDSGLRAIARDFPTSTKAYGAYINWLGYADNKSLAQAALTHGILASGWFNETQEGSQAISFSNALQCVVLNQILDDPEQNMPRLVNDLGANVGGIWATKLVNGSYAVGMFNDGASTTNMSVTWSQIGIDTNMLIAVNEVPPIGGASKGTASGSFTNSISSGSYDLFLFTPVAAVQQGVSQALVGGVGLTNGAIAAKTMSLNSPSGSSANFLTVAGITQQVYFYIGVVGFAAGGLIGMPVNGGSFFTDPDDIGGGLDIREQTGTKPVRIGSGSGNSTIQVYNGGLNISFPVTNASGYYGNGGPLTNLNAAQLTGIVPLASIPNSIQQNGIATNLTVNIGTNTSMFVSGTNALGVEIAVVNSNSASFGGLTAQADNGSFTTNYIGIYANGSKYVPNAAGGVTGSTNDLILEACGQNMFLDLIGGGKHLYGITKNTQTSAITTNFDFSATSANFKVPLQMNGAIVLTNGYFTNTATILPDGNGSLAIGTNNFGGGGGSIQNGLVTNSAPANVIVTNAGSSTTITSNSISTFLTIYTTNSQPSVVVGSGAGAGATAIVITNSGHFSDSVFTVQIITAGTTVAQQALCTVTFGNPVSPQWTVYESFCNTSPINNSGSSTLGEVHIPISTVTTNGFSLYNGVGAILTASTNNFTFIRTLSQ